MNVSVWFPSTLPLHNPPASSQGLPTSAAAIAMAALRKRDSLARDVERELKECLASCEAAAAHRDGADDAAVHGGGWKMSSGCDDETGFGLEDGTGFGLEDDMFDFTDEPCDVSCATCCVCCCAACHRVTLPRGLQASPAVVSAGMQLCDLLAQALALCCGTTPHPPQFPFCFPRFFSERCR
jgi:hypothetical protein